MFVWFVRHGRLLTNPQRSFFKSTLSVVPGGIEDLDHVFRSCPKVLAVWSLLPNPPHFSNLQETSFMVWLFLVSGRTTLLFPFGGYGDGGMKGYSLVNCLIH